MVSCCLLALFVGWILDFIRRVMSAPVFSPSAIERLPTVLFDEEASSVKPGGGVRYTASADSISSRHQSGAAEKAALAPNVSAPISIPKRTPTLPSEDVMNAREIAAARKIVHDFYTRDGADRVA